jgi:transposase-like protein
MRQLRVKKSYVYVWSAVDVDSKELLALEASYGRSSLNALAFLKKALKMCTNKPLVIVDRGPWYRWAFERLGLEYRYERFCIRNRLKLAHEGKRVPSASTLSGASFHWVRYP